MGHRKDFFCDYFIIELEFQSSDKIVGRFVPSCFNSAPHEFEGIAAPVAGSQTGIAFFIDWKLYGKLSTYFTVFNGNILTDKSNKEILKIRWLFVNKMDNFSSNGFEEMKKLSSKQSLYISINCCDQSRIPYPKPPLVSLT